ncbi:MAG: RidA family protein [Deltaproteobacteria bacterium]
MNSVTDRLNELGLILPAATAPLANYVPWVRSGTMVYISGQVSRNHVGTVMVGILGESMMTEQGAMGAQTCALALIAQMAAAVDGDWTRIIRVVKINGFVASHASFREQPIVINGASDLLVAVLSDAGRHARSAVGVASLPLGAAVEIDAIIEVR